MKRLGFPVMMLVLVVVVGGGVWSYFYSPFSVRIRRLAQVSYTTSGPRQVRAKETLKWMGPKAIPALVKLLKHPNSRVRRAATKTFTWLQTQDFIVVQSLGTLLKDPDWRVRRFAARALGKRRWRASPVLPALVQALKHEKEWLVRRDIVDAIRQMGLFAYKATPTLIRFAQDKDHSVRTAALNALTHVQALPAQTVPVFIQALQDRQWQVRERAALELKQMGTKAAPAFSALAHAAHDSNIRVRKASLQALRAIGSNVLEPMLRSSNPWQKINAAKALEVLGVEATSSISTLLEVAEDPHANIRMAALSALRHMGPQGLSAFLSLLKHPKPAMRAVVASELHQLSALAVVAAPALYRMLQDGDQQVRWSAAQAIARLPSILPTLRALLSHKDIWYRQKSVHTLSLLGERAVLILLEALSNTDALVRSKAAEALGRIHLSSSTVAYRQKLPPSLLKRGFKALILRDLALALNDKDARVKQAAVAALMKQGFDGQKHVWAFLSRCNEEQLLLALSAAPIFPTLNPKETDELLLRLRRALGSKKESNRIRSARILGKLGPKAGLATILLNQLLEDPRKRVRMASIIALSQIGSQARIAIRSLVRVVHTHSREERLAALEALVKLSSYSKRAIHALKNLLHNRSLSLRILGMQSLAQMGEKALPALPELLQALSDRRLRSYAASALSEIGEKAVPALVPVLRHQNQWVRWVVIEILASFGKKAIEAVPALRKAMQDPISAVQIAAVRALSQIVPEGAQKASANVPKKSPASRPVTRPTP